MKRLAMFLVCLGMVGGVVAAPAAALPPDRVEGTFFLGEELAECDGFRVIIEGDVHMRRTTFYERDGAVDRIVEHFTLDGVIFRNDSIETLLFERDSWTSISYPDDDQIVRHGLTYNTVVPGHGPVYKWVGTTLSHRDENGDPVIDEIRGIRIVPIDSDAEAVLCDYFG